MLKNPAGSDPEQGGAVEAASIGERSLGRGLTRSEVRHHLEVAAAGSPQETAFVLGQLSESPLLSALVGGAVGQCVRAAPPADLYVEMDELGVHYRCGHNPPHIVAIGG